MKSPKTTIAGVLTIVGAIVIAAQQYLSGQPINTSVLLTGIIGGVGLITAADAKPPAK